MTDFCGTEYEYIKRHRMKYNTPYTVFVENFYREGSSDANRLSHKTVEDARVWYY